MCLSSPHIPADTSAQQAQQQADQREAQVREGQAGIDSAFSKFDNNYFDKYKGAYEDNYNPQVDQQYGDAKQKLRYNDARRGMLDSTSAIFNQDKLNRGYGQQRQQVAADAIAATADQQNKVQQQKSQLYAMNTASADPTLASTQAAASAGTLSSTPQSSMLGDLFGGLVNAGAATAAGNARNNPYFTPNAPLPGARLPSGTGSGRVVS